MFYNQVFLKKTGVTAGLEATIAAIQNRSKVTGYRSKKEEERISYEIINSFVVFVLLFMGKLRSLIRK